MSSEANTRAGRLGAISAPEAVARIARVVDVTLVAPPDDEPGSRDLYYIQNVGRPVGNCVRWWKPNGQGYTSDLNEAWLVTKERAAQICHSRPDEDVPRHSSAMEAIAQRQVDVQALR